MTEEQIKFTSGQIRDICNVTQKALRYYHQIGLLPEPERTTGGYRMYDVSHVVRLAAIKRLNSAGLSLSEVKLVLDSDDEQQTTEILNNVENSLLAQQEKLESQLNEIRVLQKYGTKALLFNDPQFAAHDSFESEATDIFNLLSGSISPDVKEAFILLYTSDFYSKIEKLEADFKELDEQSTADEQEAFIRRALRLALDLYDAFPTLASISAANSDNESTFDLLIKQLMNQHLNDTQINVMNRFEKIWKQYTQ